MKKWLSGTFIVIFLLFVGWIFSEAIHATSSSKGVGLDYPQFRQTMPTPSSAHVLLINSEEYVALVGRVRTPFAFPSGPPIYIFDNDGKFIDFTLNSDDTQRFGEKWLRTEKREVTIDEADRMIQAHRKIEQASDGNAEKPPGIEREP